MLARAAGPRSMDAEWPPPSTVNSANTPAPPDAIEIARRSLDGTQVPARRVPRVLREYLRHFGGPWPCRSALRRPSSPIALKRRQNALALHWHRTCPSHLSGSFQGPEHPPLEPSTLRRT